MLGTGCAISLKIDYKNLIIFDTCGE